MNKNFLASLIITGITITNLLPMNTSAQQQETSNMQPVTHNAALIEQTEIAAWQDLIDAAPNTFKISNGMEHKNFGGGMATHFQKMPIPLFNRVIGLGLTQPLEQQTIDDIKAFYSHKEKYLIHYSSPMKPAGADSLLKKNGFYLAGSWERIVRGNDPLPVDGDNDSIIVKQVDASLKEDWVNFLIDTYDFDFYVWPRAFCLRKGWKHYVAYDKNNKIIACRSFFMTGKKTVFSGVDAPVPGVMTPNCVPDFAIWKRAIRDAIKEGAILFVADIELPDKIRNKAAYEGFQRLGFQIPYTRYHYRLNK